MSKFSRFLAGVLSSRGSQSEVARAIGASPGTVTKWLSGENVPNFESCLRLADYLNMEPSLILKLVGNLEYYRLYLRLFKQVEFQTDLHSRLQSLIDRGYSEMVDSALYRLESIVQQDGEGDFEPHGRSERPRVIES